MIAYIAQSGKAGHDMHLLQRRGFEFGWIREDCRPTFPDSQNVVQAWNHDDVICLPGLAVDTIKGHADDIERARELIEKVTTVPTFYRTNSTG